jgi:hypothetical protein
MSGRDDRRYDDRALWGELRELVAAVPATSPRELTSIFVRFSPPERNHRVAPYLRGALGPRWQEWRRAWPADQRWRFDVLADWIGGVE